VVASGGNGGGGGAKYISERKRPKERGKEER